jgi:hypothetical protein
MTLRFATSWLGQVAAYLAAVSAAVLAFNKLDEPLRDLPVWVRWAIILSPIVLALALHTVPSLVAAHRLERLKEITGSLKPGYFSLAPREDETSFRRADGKHHEILRWLEQRVGRVLYLTGFSGSGKSSLVKAWVLPRLERQGTRVIFLRGYNARVDVLQQELTKPGVIWQKPPRDQPTARDLLKQASRHLSSDKLLIVIDQFEECLILHEGEQPRALFAFLSQLSVNPLPNVTVLLVFRSDYTGQVAELQLPPLTQGDNWREVPPFTERDAYEFVLGSGLTLNEKLLREVLREAAEIEQTKGLIRPITINLCGLVLGRFANGVPRGFRPGELIRGFLQESVRLPIVREVAARVLPRLITPAVTKVPRTVTDLADTSNIERAAVRGCLLTLGQADRGIVRPLDSNQETWEISHDFLVPLLDSILARSSVSLWRHVRPYFPWAAAFALGVTLGTLSPRPPSVPHFGELSPLHTSDVEAFKALAEATKPGSFPTSRGGPEPNLKLSDVFGPAGLEVTKRIGEDGRIVFHAVGSTGNTASAGEGSSTGNTASMREGADGPRQMYPLLVADRMENDFRENSRKPRPSFLFHLGDVVYNFGESEYYYGQFYIPYVQYPAPILAIAGNHDGMVPPGSPAKPLQAFLENFCANRFYQTPASRGVGRTAQIQPGVYYTFEAPFLRILALYSNVPESAGIISSQRGEYPQVTDVQLHFLEAALGRIKAESFSGAILIAVHHDPYSPNPHGGSPRMLRDIDGVSKRTGVWPHAVLSANAHNYQRYTRRVNDNQIPFVVAGNGGHGFVRLGGNSTRPGNPLPVESGNVVLEQIHDDGLGFLRVTVDPARLHIEYQPVKSATPTDSVTVDLKSRQVVKD